MQYLTEEILNKYLPGIQERCPMELERTLPFVHVEPQSGQRLTVVAFSFLRRGIEPFSIEMLTKHILPMVTCELGVLYTTQCKLFALEAQEYFLLYAEVLIPNGYTTEEVYEHIPLFIREMKLGMRSPYHERKIREMKVLSNEDKHCYIQDRTSALLEKFPERFDYDLYAYIQRFLLTTKETFRKERTARHILRIILSIYTTIARIEKEAEKMRYKRHLYCRAIHGVIEQPFGKKRILGFVIGVHFLKENEIFERRHIVNILQKTIPNVKVIPDTYYGYKNEKGYAMASYLEIEKEGQWTAKDIQKMQQEILVHLRVGIEQLVRPLFMPRNEEEVLKYTVQLTQEINSVDDIGQMVILFQEQTDDSLFFSVVLVRPFFSELSSVEDMVSLHDDGALDIYVEKTKEVGRLDDVVSKESCILRVRLNNTPFLRDDGAVDLYKARHKVVQKMQDIFGQLRDYNGGMIAKQTESLDLLRQDEDNQFFLENFFYSISPSELRSILRTDILRRFYKLFLQVSNGEDEIVVQQEDEHIMLFLRLANVEERDSIQADIKKLEIPYPHLVFSKLPIGENIFLGYILFSEDRILKDDILQIVGYSDTEEVDSRRALHHRG